MGRGRVRMGRGRRSWVLVLGGRGSMAAVVAEDGGGGSFMGGWRPRRLCLLGGGGAGTRGHPSVGTSLSLSGCLPHRWQRRGTWD